MGGRGCEEGLTKAESVGGREVGGGESEGGRFSIILTQMQMQAQVQIQMKMKSKAEGFLSKIIRAIDSTVANS